MTNIKQICMIPYFQTPIVVKRNLSYLQGIIDYELPFKKYNQLILLALVDYDWKINFDDRKSTINYYVYLGCNLIYLFL